MSHVPPADDNKWSTPPPPPPPPGLTPPPGYAAYDNVPVPAGGTRRIGGLATAVVVTTLLAGVSGMIATVLSAGQSADAENFLAGSITEAEFDTATAPAASLQSLAAVATLVTAVLTIIWMFRIASNVRAVGRTTTWSPLFSIFGWLLPPGVLYVIPFLVLRELWKASDPSPPSPSPGSAPSNGDQWRRSPDNPVLWVWFALFGLVTAALFGVDLAAGDLTAATSTSRTALAERLVDFGAIEWLSSVANFLAAVTWVVFVRQLTARHRRLTGSA